MAGQGRDAPVDLDQNKIAQQEIATSQKNQVSETIGSSGEIINQCNDSSRDLGNQANAFSQKFIRVKYRKCDAEKEILSGKSRRNALANHGMGEQIETKFIKSDLQQMRAQNRRRASKIHVIGRNRNLFGGEPNVTGGGEGGNDTATVPMLSQRPMGQDKRLQKAYRFDEHAPARDLDHAPARDTESAPKIDQKLSNITENQQFGQNFANRGSIPGPTATRRLLPNGMIDARLAFTPHLYQNWRREVKLWRSAKIGGEYDTTDCGNRVGDTRKFAHGNIELFRKYRKVPGDPARRRRYEHIEHMIWAN